MSIGTKIAARVPDSIVLYVAEHPTALCVGTFALTVVTLSLFVAATELDVRATIWRKAQLGEIQRAASEALGG
jgi:hypothetical protein